MAQFYTFLVSFDEPIAGFTPPIFLQVGSIYYNVLRVNLLVTVCSSQDDRKQEDDRKGRPYYRRLRSPLQSGVRF